MKVCDVQRRAKRIPLQERSSSLTKMPNLRQYRVTPSEFTSTMVHHAL